MATQESWNAMANSEGGATLPSATTLTGNHINLNVGSCGQCGARAHALRRFLGPALQRSKTSRE